jgi:hypothetical protein
LGIGLWKEFGRVWRCGLEKLSAELKGQLWWKLRRQNISRNVGSEGQAHEISDRNKNSPGNWTRGPLNCILANNLSTFCPCPKTLWEAEFKGNGLITLVKEMQCSIQTVASLFLAAFSQAYMKNKEQKAKLFVLKNLQFGQKS